MAGIIGQFGSSPLAPREFNTGPDLSFLANIGQTIAGGILNRRREERQARLDTLAEQAQALSQRNIESQIADRERSGDLSSRTQDLAERRFSAEQARAEADRADALQAEQARREFDQSKFDRELGFKRELLGDERRTFDLEQRYKMLSAAVDSGASEEELRAFGQDLGLPDSNVKALLSISRAGSEQAAKKRLDEDVKQAVGIAQVAALSNNNQLRQVADLLLRSALSRLMPTASDVSPTVFNPSAGGVPSLPSGGLPQLPPLLPGPENDGTPVNIYRETESEREARLRREGSILPQSTEYPESFSDRIARFVRDVRLR